MAQLLWGIFDFIDYSRSVGATAEPAGGWVYSGLGLLGLLVLAMPRCGLPVAVAQFLTASYALCWVPLGVISLRTPPSLLLPLPLGNPAIALVILMSAGGTALLCLLSALGAWKAARLASRRQATLG